MEHFKNTSANGVANNSTIKTRNKRPRVFIADDNTPMLEMIVRLLTPQFEIVGTAADGKAAIEGINRLKPDIAVLDISMPFKTGIEIAADLNANAPDIKVVIVSAHNDESHMQAARSAGALAYIVKKHLADELVPVIKSAYSANGLHSSPLRGQ